MKGSPATMKIGSAGHFLKWKRKRNWSGCALFGIWCLLRQRAQCLYLTGLARLPGVFTCLGQARSWSLKSKRNKKLDGTLFCLRVGCGSFGTQLLCCCYFTHLSSCLSKLLLSTQITSFTKTSMFSSTACSFLISFWTSLWLTRTRIKKWRSA